MWQKVIPWVVALFFLVEVQVSRSQEDSLKSALKAVNRLQRDLSGNHGYEDYYFTDDYPSSSERRNVERELFDQLQDGGDLTNDLYKLGMKKRFSSSFRERVLEENNNEENKKYLTEMLLNQLHSRENSFDEDEDYPEMLKEVWDSYSNRDNFREYPKVYSNDRYAKRYFPVEYYPSLGYNNVGMKKRNRNIMYMPKSDHSDDYDQYIENFDIPRQYFDSQKPKEYYNYPMKKQFRVSKRSNPEKKSTKKDLLKTDPKIEKDLSNIFVKPKKSKTHENRKKPTKTEHSPVDLKKSPEKKNMKTRKNETVIEKANDNKKAKSLNKETTALGSNQEPLHIEKKSINWSDYFGIDKRKANDLDDEWLIERYHKAVAMAVKRDPTNKNYEKEVKPEFLKNDKQVLSSKVNIDKVDSDLKDAEESLIDETLKYTGAHEGVSDLKEIQDLKDRIISQLAAAYNLEKMRQALGEYKNSIAKQKNQINQRNIDVEKLEPLSSQQELKENEDGLEKDNSKCDEADVRCQEKNFLQSFGKTPWSSGSCTKIQNVCKDQAVDFLGIYNHLLTSACTYHQTCLLCNENTWFSPTRECNQLFLEKANSLCSGDYICQRVARNSIPHLLNFNKAIILESDDQCTQYCLKSHKANKTI